MVFNQHSIFLEGKNRIQFNKFSVIQLAVYFSAISFLGSINRIHSTLFDKCVEVNRLPVMINGANAWPQHSPWDWVSLVLHRRGKNQLMQQHESDPQESLPQITLRQEKYLAEDLNPSEALPVIVPKTSHSAAFSVLLQVGGVKVKGNKCGWLIDWFIGHSVKTWLNRTRKKQKGCRFLFLDKSSDFRSATTLCRTEIRRHF